MKNKDPTITTQPVQSTLHAHCDAITSRLKQSDFAIASAQLPGVLLVVGDSGHFHHITWRHRNSSTGQTHWVSVHVSHESFWAFKKDVSFRLIPRRHTTQIFSRISSLRRCIKVTPHAYLRSSEGAVRTGCRDTFRQPKLVLTQHGDHPTLTNPLPNSNWVGYQSSSFPPCSRIRLQSPQAWHYRHGTHVPSKPMGIRSCHPCICTHAIKAIKTHRQGVSALRNYQAALFPPWAGPMRHVGLPRGRLCLICASFDGLGSDVGSTTGRGGWGERAGVARGRYVSTWALSGVVSQTFDLESASSLQAQRNNAHRLRAPPSCFDSGVWEATLVRAQQTGKGERPRRHASSSSWTPCFTTMRLQYVKMLAFPGNATPRTVIDSATRCCYSAHDVQHTPCTTTPFPVTPFCSLAPLLQGLWVSQAASACVNVDECMRNCKRRSLPLADQAAAVPRAEQSAHLLACA